MSATRANLFRHPELDPTARLIALYKLEFPGDQTLPEIARELNLTEARARTALAELAIEGFAKRTTVRAEGHRQPPRRIWSFVTMDLPDGAATTSKSYEMVDLPDGGSTISQNHQMGATSGNVEFDAELDGEASRAVSPAPAPRNGINTKDTKELEQQDLLHGQEVPPNKDTLVEGGVGGDPDAAPAAPRRAQRTYSEEFEMVWAAYGRRGSKPAAWAQWQKAIKREDADVIIVAMYAYIQATAEEPKFRKHLERWLRDDCWLSDLPVAKTKKEQESEKRRDMGSHERHEEKRKLRLSQWTNPTFKANFGFSDKQIARMREEYNIPEPQEDQQT